MDWSYDAAGRRATMTVLGQPTVSYGYDNADRLASVTQGTAAVTMAYDDAGRRQRLTLPNNVRALYDYDKASRLTGITFKKGTTTLGDLSYTYDAAGRRTSIGGTWARTGIPQSFTSATYNANNQQVSGVG